MSTNNIQDLMSQFPQPGTVEWIGVRPERREELKVLDSVQACPKQGLVGDHFSGKPGDKRMVTLIQQEHITVVGKMLGKDAIDPGLLRRNIVVSGLNLLALKNRRFRIGGAVFEGTTSCPPCSRMEENLGVGGYNAMRGHGGVNAKVLETGEITVGDIVEVLPSTDDVPE